MLVDMEAEVAALRALVYRCSEIYDRILGLERAGAQGSLEEIADQKRRLRELTPLVKWFGSERALWVARTAVQVHGGYGVIREYDVERHYRDALILPIYEGTSQIQSLMSLKDQLKWAFERPWRLLTGPVAVKAPADTMGDALREMASEYNRALRSVLRGSIGGAGILAALLGRRGGVGAGDYDFVLLWAERLAAMLAYTRAAEALAAGAGASSERRRLAERFVHRALPLVRMHGDIVRSGDRSTLEALQG
jgi:hypothetical protein